MCRAGFRRVESGSMEPEFEKPRNVPGDSPALPYCASIISLVIYAVSGCLVIAASSCLFSSQKGAATNLFVSGIGLLGIGRIVYCLERLVQLREWELTRRLKKKEE